MSPPLGKVFGVAPPYNYLLPLSEVNRISVLVPPVQLFFDQELIADSPTEAPTTVVSSQALDINNIWQIIY